jgi:hypothetical protein
MKVQEKFGTFTCLKLYTFIIHLKTFQNLSLIKASSFMRLNSPKLWLYSEYTITKKFHSSESKIWVNIDKLNIELFSDGQTLVGICTTLDYRVD